MKEKKDKSRAENSTILSPSLELLLNVWGKGQQKFARSFKVARYVIYGDAIIAVRASTNENDINNNYNNNNT